MKKNHKNLSLRIFKILIILSSFFEKFIFDFHPYRFASVRFNFFLITPSNFLLLSNFIKILDQFFF